MSSNRASDEPRGSAIGSLASEQRRSWLLEQLRADNSMSLTAAAASLGVSEMTVRRDFDHLESLGVARRVRGGAVYGGPVSFKGRERAYAGEKRRIAEKLLPLVPANGLIAIDSSTTMYRLAQNLVGDGDLTVVTNGLLTFQALQERPGITAILTGGVADRRSDSLVGPVAAATLEGLRFSTFFSSTAAVDASWCYEDTMDEASIKRAFARSSGRVIVGVNSQKLRHDATAASFDLALVSKLVTELDPSEDALGGFRDLVLEVA